jgi:nucleosome binding factor SPN SPT16 subunit
VCRYSLYKRQAPLLPALRQGALGHFAYSPEGSHHDWQKEGTCK